MSAIDEQCSRALAAICEITIGPMTSPTSMTASMAAYDRLVVVLDTDDALSLHVGGSSVRDFHDAPSFILFHPQPLLRGTEILRSAQHPLMIAYVATTKYLAAFSSMEERSELSGCVRYHNQVGPSRMAGTQWTS